MALSPPISRTPSGYVLGEQVDAGFYGTRWCASKPSEPGLAADFVAVEDDDFIVALCTNAMCVKEVTASPYTVNVVDAGWVDNGDYYQVLDILPGAVALSKKKIPLLEGEALMAGLALVRALKHLHKREFLHAAICPEAVYGLDGKFQLGEFWWAHTLSGKTLNGDLFEYFPRMVQPSALRFLAPEVLLGFPPSRESDLYSLGALLFFLLTGETPGAADGHADFEMRAKQDFRSLSECGRSFSPATVNVVDKLLDPNADNRSNIFRFEEMLAFALGEEISTEILGQSE